MDKTCKRCGGPLDSNSDFCQKCYKGFCDFMNGKDFSAGYEQGQKDLYEQIMDMVKCRFPEAYRRFSGHERADN